MSIHRIVALSSVAPALAAALLSASPSAMASPPVSPSDQSTQSPSAVTAAPSCRTGYFCSFDGSSYTGGRKDFAGEIDNLSYSGWKFSSGKSMYKAIESGVNRSSGNNRTTLFKSPGRTGDVAFCVNPKGNAAYLKEGQGNSAVSVTWVLGPNRSCFSG